MVTLAQAKAGFLAGYLLGAASMFLLAVAVVHIRRALRRPAKPEPETCIHGVPAPCGICHGVSS